MVAEPVEAIGFKGLILSTVGSTGSPTYYVADNPPSDNQDADCNDDGKTVEGVVEARVTVLEGDGGQQGGDVGEAHH